MIFPGRSELIPGTRAAGMMVPAITVYGEVGACKVPVLLVAASPLLARNASFWSCRFWSAVGSLGCAAVDAGPATIGLNGPRSEEHTSELQSLMRISYAVFCLKKKKNIREDSQLLGIYR